MYNNLNAKYLHRDVNVYHQIGNIQMSTHTHHGGETVGKQTFPYIVGGSVNWDNPTTGRAGQTYQNCKTPVGSPIPFLDIYLTDT